MRLSASIALCAVLLAACGGSSQAPPAGSAPPQTASPSGAAKPSAAQQGLAKLTMSHSQIAGDQMVTWVAKEAGIYDKNGLNLDLRLVESTTGISALLGGDVEISTIGGSEAMAAAAGGADVIIAATLAPVYTFKMEVASSIKTKEDLVGKKLGVTRPGSTTDTGTRDSLRKIGLVPDKDVTIMPLGASKTATVAGLLNGVVQGILQQPPDDLEIEDKGFHALYDLATMGLPSAAAVILTQRSWASAHRELMQKFIDSLVQATALEKKDRALGERVVRKYYKTEDERLIKYAYEYHSAIHPPYPYPRIEQYQTITANIKQQNANAKDFNFDKVIEPSFVKSAEDRGLANS